MRVLLVHSHYRSDSPSGENVVFGNERDLLARAGIDVVTFERFNDEIDATRLIDRLRLARDAAWSRQTYRELSDLIQSTRPDIAHFHNTFPLISPSGYAACADRGVPVVQTIHNYRLFCPSAVFMRSGRICEECLGRTPFPAIRHRCYRGSAAATGAIVWMLVRNRLRGTYRRLVNRYIAMTEFAARKLIAGGLRPDRVEVKPNFLPDPPSCGGAREECAVYVGRLSAEKGVRTLVAAWGRVAKLPLKVVGDGPLRTELVREAERENAAVEFLGFRPHEEVMAIVGRGLFQVIPSECYESFPLALIEAYASGTPVLAARIGSLGEAVLDGETGVTFTPGDKEELALRADALAVDRRGLERMGRACRRLFEEKYTAESNFGRLMEIYDHAVEDSRQSRMLQAPYGPL